MLHLPGTMWQQPVELDDQIGTQVAAIATKSVMTAWAYAKYVHNGLLPPCPIATRRKVTVRAFHPGAGEQLCAEGCSRLQQLTSRAIPAHRKEDGTGAILVPQLGLKVCSSRREQSAFLHMPALAQMQPMTEASSHDAGAVCSIH